MASIDNPNTKQGYNNHLIVDLLPYQSSDMQPSNRATITLFEQNQFMRQQ